MQDSATIQMVEVIGLVLSYVQLWKPFIKSKLKNEKLHKPVLVTLAAGLGLLIGWLLYTYGLPLWAEMLLAGGAAPGFFALVKEFATQEKKK